MPDDALETESVAIEQPLDEGFSAVFAVLDQAERARRGFFKRLAAMREQLGLSQAEVARRMGTSQPAVARLEAGLADPKISTLERAAAAMGYGLTLSLTPITEQAQRLDALTRQRSSVVLEAQSVLKAPEIMRVSFGHKRPVGRVEVDPIPHRRHATYVRFGRTNTARLFSLRDMASGVRKDPSVTARLDNPHEKLVSRS